MYKGVGGHQSARMVKDEWLTPPNIISSLGVFDLDPCAPTNRPWNTAKNHYTKEDDGLKLPWKGRVWCNPPYGRNTTLWLDKLAAHNNGIALVFARTETQMFFDSVWGVADAILFLRGRIHFHHIDGLRASGNSGAPSVLIAYGLNNAESLLGSKIPGSVVKVAAVV